MPRIPLTVRAVGEMSQSAYTALQATKRVLLAAILRSEDDCLTLTEQELLAADSYTLKVTVIPEEGDAIVLSAVPRRH